MCTGLLSQPISTIPLAENASGWFLFDIDGAHFEPGQERAFVDAVLERARVLSPLSGLRDWRHVPSDSA
eukprot:3526040-Rhodomonas_salina.1